MIFVGKFYDGSRFFPSWSPSVLFFGVVFKSCNFPSVGHSSLLSVRICLFSQQFTELFNPKSVNWEKSKHLSGITNHELS